MTQVLLDRVNHFLFISSEKASPLKLLAYRPACLAFCSNATELYHPAEAVRLSSGSFSKKTPMVEAPQPNAETILDARP